MVCDPGGVVASWVATILTRQGAHYEEPMQTFSVKNFDKFQHYKRRRPPWIKLYNDLLEDYTFSHLDDRDKFHLIAIYLLASRYQNVIPFDSKWVARQIGATAPVDLERLKTAGFILLEQGGKQDASTMLASCKQSAIPETERETEREGERVEARVARASKKGTRLPDDWVLPKEWRDWALSEGRDLDIDDQALRFRDYWVAKPGSGATKLDWQATWRNWIRNAKPGNGKAGEDGLDRAFRKIRGEVRNGNSGVKREAAAEVLPAEAICGPRDICPDDHLSIHALFRDDPHDGD